MILRFYPFADPRFGRIIILPFVKDSVNYFVFPLNMISEWTDVMMGDDVVNIGAVGN